MDASTSAATALRSWPEGKVLERWEPPRRSSGLPPGVDVTASHAASAVQPVVPATRRARSSAGVSLPMSLRSARSNASAGRAWRTMSRRRRSACAPIRVLPFSQRDTVSPAVPHVGAQFLTGRDGPVCGKIRAGNVAVLTNVTNSVTLDRDQELRRQADGSRFRGSCRSPLAGRDSVACEIEAAGDRCGHSAR